MKILKTVPLLACFSFCMLWASAQTSPVPLNQPNYNKAKIFTDLPDKQPLHLKDLQSLLDLNVGSPVAVTVAKGLLLNGTVVSKSNPSDKSVKSVVIRSNSRQGTTFTFTRITEADGTFSYTGRMMNRNAGDALEITREADGYVIRKKGIHEMLNE